MTGPETQTAQLDLTEALEVTGNLVCMVGAGGKKTTIYHLANRLSRAVVTSTVRIPIFDRQVAEVVVAEDPVGALQNRTRWPVGVVPEQEDDRYLGYDTETVDDLATSGIPESVLVKADGARTRWFKAPNASEPRIPESTDVVVPIASAKVVGKPLTDEYVHRVDLVSDLTGLDRGDVIEPKHVAMVLASPAGGQKHVPSGADTIPLINMADDAALAAVAREIGARIHRRAAVPRVVIAQMTDDDPVVDIVT